MYSGTSVYGHLTSTVTLAQSQTISHSRNESGDIYGNTVTSLLRSLLPHSVGVRIFYSEVPLYFNYRNQCFTGKIIKVTAWFNQSSNQVVSR